MKSCSLILRLAATLLAAAFAGNASAALVVYAGADNNVSDVSAMTNSNNAAAAFDAAASPLSLITFESSLPSGVFISGGTITNISGCGALCGFNTTASGANFLSMSGSTATFTFSSGVNAFGFYVTGLQTDYVPQETVTFSDGSSQLINVPSAINGGGAFIGFTDAGKSIVSVTYNATNDIVAVDDVRYSVAAVPEPSTYAMLLLGLGLCGVALRRQNT